MISTTDLQALIEKIDGGTKGVDLVKIGLEHYNGKRQRDYSNDMVSVMECVNYVLQLFREIHVECVSP